MKVLVTGSAGFIGSHLVERLVALGHSVRAMIHYNFQNSWGWLETLSENVLDAVEIFPADIADGFAVRRAVEGVDSVFHLAALIAIPYSYVAPASFVSTNVSGTLNVLEACRAEGVSRLVHTSTSETYGTAQYAPIDEKHPLVGQSPYSASKIGADMLAESYFRSFDLPVATIRPFNTFGPRQSARAVIPTIITQALSGAKSISLGALSPVRDFNFVADTVEGFLAVHGSDAAVGEVVNIGSGRGATIGETAEMILDICGVKAEIVCDEPRIRPEKSEVRKLLCDNTRARALVGWEPRHTLREGLEKTVEWFSRNLSRYKANIYNL